jgi:transcriptional regulator with PAS, ATPase and Fis domain
MMAASGFSPSDLSRTDKAVDESPKGFKAYKSDKKQWGAVILDEIGSLDLIVQAKLLLVIEGEPMHPVGWTSDGFLPNFRIIAATNQIRDLRTHELFRPDLLKRLSTYVMQCKDLADEPNEKIREIIRSVSIPIRLNGRPSPSVSPRFSKEAVDQLVAKKAEIKGGYRELHSIIERAWLNSKKLPGTGQEVEITAEDIQRGREFSVEVYSQFDKNDSSVERDVYVSSDAEVKELKIKIANALSVDPVDLNHISFRNAVAQSSNTEVLKKELKLVLGIDGVPAAKKKSIFTALGLALDYKPREKKVQPGTKEYARVMSNYFSKQFGQTPAKTSEDIAE